MALAGYQYKEQGPTSHLAEQRDEDLQGGKDAKDIKATTKEAICMWSQVTKDVNMMLCV